MGLFAILFILLSPSPAFCVLLLLLLLIMEAIEPAGFPKADDCEGGGNEKVDDGVAVPLPGGGGRENDDAERLSVFVAGRCWLMDKDAIEFDKPPP